MKGKPDLTCDLATLSCFDMKGESFVGHFKSIVSFCLPVYVRLCSCFSLFLCFFLSFILYVCVRLFVWPVPLSPADFVSASLAFFADPTNAFCFSTLELDYTLPKEKEKNGIAASADPPRRSKKARTQPKSEFSALPPPPPPCRCPGCALCTVTVRCAGMLRAT